VKNRPRHVRSDELASRGRAPLRFDSVQKAVSVTVHRCVTTAEHSPFEIGAPGQVSERELLLAARELRMKLLRQLGQAEEIAHLPPIGPVNQRPSDRSLICISTLVLLGVILMVCQRPGRRAASVS
jgi:hypothetical protein